MMQIASRTTLIPCGGLAIVLTNEISCSFRVFNAATAAFKAGRAMFSCSSHSSYKSNINLTLHWSDHLINWDCFKWELNTVSPTYKKILFFFHTWKILFENSQKWGIRFRFLDTRQFQFFCAYGAKMWPLISAHVPYMQRKSLLQHPTFRFFSRNLSIAGLAKIEF